MRRLLILILSSLCILLPLPAAGWLVGGEAGYALTLMDTVTTWPDTWYKPGHGGSAALIAEYGFDNGLSISTGLRYIGKGFWYYHENAGYVRNDYMEMDHFLEIPLVLRYTYRMGDIGLFIGGGGYAGIWFLAQCFGKNESPSIVGNDTIIYDSHGDIMPFGANDNLFEAGLLAEAGVSWNVAEDIRLDFTFRYEGNMTSLVRNTQKNTAHRYYDTMQFAVGCLVAVGGEA